FAFQLLRLPPLLGPLGLGEEEGRPQRRRRRRGRPETVRICKHPPLQRAFRETSVDTPWTRPSQQRSGRRQDWKKPKCKVQPKGRKQKCLTCVKLRCEDKVLGRMVHCPAETQTRREPEEHHEARCSRSQRALRTPRLLLPAQFASSKARPPAERSTESHGAPWSTGGVTSGRPHLPGGGPQYIPG
uniref:Uncharacterized protein n=1 Tax=Theropithecus gelada TaxID=9565 RepID=A0A8D2G7S1_THEGE